MSERDSVINKFHPSHLDTSPFMGAILGALLDQEWTEPTLAPHFSVTSDGFVLADMGNRLLCDFADFKRNIEGVCDAVDLTPDERWWFQKQLDARITYFNNERIVVGSPFMVVE